MIYARCVRRTLTVAFTLGVLLWCIYGFSHGQISIIASNGITLALASVILGMKLRYR